MLLRKRIRLSALDEASTAKENIGRLEEVAEELTSALVDVRRRRKRRQKKIAKNA